TEAYLACSKTGIMEANIKMALRIVMERDSKNPTPTIDTEPKVYWAAKSRTVIDQSSDCTSISVRLF
ncbi:hypothetical protein KQI61_18775, partial [Anaerocolumna aminovalerica]|uniref:hypothetical protein n=1 Tax=Anaerocolumna aminovalerica TaxID=1527 RepID=UPI001C0EA662